MAAKEIYSTLSIHHFIVSIDFATQIKPAIMEKPTEVGAFYWTDVAPDIVNPGREEQG